MKVDVRVITFNDFTLIGSILIPSTGNRLVIQPVKGLEGAEDILTDMVNSPIPVGGKLIRSKDNPKLFLQNLPNIYRNGYVYAKLVVKKDVDTVTISPVLPEEPFEKTIEPISSDEIAITVAQAAQWIEEQDPITADGIDTTDIADLLGVEKSIDDEFSITLTLDDSPVQLPEYLQDQLPIIPDGVESIQLPPEVEKGLFRFLTGALQTFKGLIGRWITTKGGGKVFIEQKVKVAKGISDTEVASVLDIFNKLPNGIRKQIKTINITGEAKIGKFEGTAGGVGDLFGGNRVLQLLGEPLRPDGKLKLSSLKVGMLGRFNWKTKTMTVSAGNLNRMKKANLPSPIPLTFKAFVNHEAGHSMYVPFAAIKQNKTLTRLQNNFVKFSKTEGAVSQYAAQFQILTQLPKAAFPPGAKSGSIPLTPLYVRFGFGTENFAEMHRLYRDRGSVLGGGAQRWRAIQKTNPKSVEVFLAILKEFNAV